MPASSSACASLSGVCPPNWTMTPSSSPFCLLDAQDLEHVLGGQRLEIEPVGGVVVGAHRLRVAVDHDRLVARFGQREAGVDAAIVELDALPDAVRPAAEDDDLAAVGRRGLALGLAEAGRFVGRVHVGRHRLELGGAAVDPLEHRMHAELAGAAARTSRSLVAPAMALSASWSRPERARLGLAQAARDRRPSAPPASPAACRKSPSPSAAAAPRRRPAGRSALIRASSAMISSMWRRNHGS